MSSKENMCKYLAKLLEVHWLRPETALWRTFDCMLMEKHGDINGRSIDLGCGDGTLSFLMAGGGLDEYDVFMDVDELDSYNSGSDIYNQKTSLVPILNVDSIRYTYEWGVDHKQGLIDKAKRFFPFYQNSLLVDLNNSTTFEDNYFDSSFSNVLYWLDDMEVTLSEWSRILKSRGKLYLFVPNSSFRGKAWLYYSAPHSGDKRYFNLFDRGYSSLIRQCHSTEEWIRIFQRNGFEVIDHHLYLTNPVIDIWNLGTRPIAPLLINMSKMLSFECRKEAKAEWVDYFTRFFQPIVEGEFERKVPEHDAAFHFFILENN